MTHSMREHGAAAKFLVIPAGEEIAADFTRTIAALDIRARQYRLVGSARERTVQSSWRAESPQCVP
jgi:hypothetical protein